MKHITFFSTTTPLELPLQYLHPPGEQKLDFANGDLRINRSFLQPEQASRLQRELLKDVEWRQDSITLFGKTHVLPRLHQWYGDSCALYSWSGLAMRPLPWLAALTDLRHLIEFHTGAVFNSVLVNLYRDGSDCMGWHSDDEAELGSQPVVASVSLGATRDLLLRRRHSRNAPSVRVMLNHGSLLVMAGSTQTFWQHALPRRKHVTEPRVNLTFRHIRTQTSGR